MPNAASRASIRSAEKDQALAESVRRQVIVALMSDPDGRRYVHDQLESAHIFSTSFHENTHVMAFLEGERNSGLRLFADLMTHCPEQFVQMMREKNARDDLDAKRNAEPAADDDAPGEPIPDLFGADVYDAA